MASVYGIGNPLMDMIFMAGFDALEKIRAVPGSMNLIDFQMMETVLSLNPRKDQNAFTRIPGGSCANTMRGIAWLRGDDSSLEAPFYSGSVGRDEIGAEFEQLLVKFGVQPHLSFTRSPSGVSVILVTPDHERTMFTLLGACRDYTLNDLKLEDIGQARFLYITGYMWDTRNQKDAVSTAVEYARDHDVEVVFDLADPFVVERYGDELRTWLSGRTDILFANREELRRITGGTGDREILELASAIAPLVVMKTGSEGCRIIHEGVQTTIPAEVVDPLDTTGAGDAFAAGFLFGLLKGRSIETSGRLANRVAGGIVTVEGCNFTLLDRDRVLREI